VQVLVAWYRFGLNWQNACHNVVLVAEAPSMEVEKQAIGRIARIGQKKAIRVIRLPLETVGARQRLSLFFKCAIPSIIADLGESILSDTDGLGDMEIGEFCLVDGELVPAGNVRSIEQVWNLFPRPLPTLDVIKTIQRQQMGLTI